MDAGNDVFLFHTLTDAVAVVSADVFESCFAGHRPDRVDPDEASALEEARLTLRELGFLVDAPEDDDRALEEYFARVRDSRDELRVTVLTTLRCNLACGYCIQGTHAAHAPHMSLDDADRVCGWIETKLDEVRPVRLVVTFFGGEPLLNVPALERIAVRAHAAATARGVEIAQVLITNGLLLSRQLVDRLLPLGLRTVKVTLDGDAPVHDRMRPTPGGRGSFDVILENLREIAGTCGISIGGNVTVASTEGCVRLMDQIATEPFRPSLSGVSFKPVVPAGPAVIPLTVTSEGSGCGSAQGRSQCDSCGFSDRHWAWLREQAVARGLPTPDGVHMGPCEIHRRHAYTVGPDGRLYACPGYAGREPFAVGHIVREPSSAERDMLARRQRLAAWRACGDCSFVPVCAGGCSVAASAEHGDMEAPACHKPAFEAALATFARVTTQEAQS
jgi:uncharacterized protein